MWLASSPSHNALSAAIVPEGPDGLVFARGDTAINLWPDWELRACRAFRRNEQPLLAIVRLWPSTALQTDILPGSWQPRDRSEIKVAEGRTTTVEVVLIPRALGAGLFIAALSIPRHEASELSLVERQRSASEQRCWIVGYLMSARKASSAALNLSGNS